MPLLVPESSWVAPTSLPDLRNIREVAIDTETRDDGLSAGRGPGWVYGAGYVCGVSAAWNGGSLYAPLQHPDSPCMSREVVGDWLRNIFESNARVVFQNAPYDLGWIGKEFGLTTPPANIDDTVAMAVMIDENRKSYDLDMLCRDEGIPGKDETLLREAAAAYCTDAKKELWRLPASYVGGYAEQDAAGTLALARSLRPKMAAEGVEGAYALEMELVPCTIEMRRRGIRIDTEAVERGAEELLVIRDDLLSEISRRLARRVTVENLRSAKWMEEVFKGEGIPFPRTGGPTELHPRKKDQGSFKAEWMRKSPHWLPRLCAQAEQLAGGADKFLRTYLLGYAHRGRIHASINQFKSDDGGTKTHRVSYSDPPLQQMPSRSKIYPNGEPDLITPEIIKRVRVALLPEEGHVWGAHDYSQQEYRLIVHYAAVEGLSKVDIAVARYIADPRTDYHTMVADMTRLPRPRAKDVNFAKSYGAGLDKFCEMTGLSLEEGARVMSQYDDELPFVKELGQAADRRAQQTGYVRLLDGARCHYNLWEPSYSESYSVPLPWEAAQKAYKGKRLRRAMTRKAGNAVIQGSAARQTKRAWVASWRAGHCPLLQMHDELGYSWARGEAGRKGAEEVAEIMRTVVKLRVPIIVDSEFGPNWGQAKHSWQEAMEIRS